jgi:hypothetical protein
MLSCSLRIFSRATLISLLLRYIIIINISKKKLLLSSDHSLQRALNGHGVGAVVLSRPISGHGRAQRHWFVPCPQFLQPQLPAERKLLRGGASYCCSCRLVYEHPYALFFGSTALMRKV